MSAVEMGICPVCAGSGKDHTGRECTNCGGQKMYGTGKGVVRLNRNGQPCVHEYVSTIVGRCLTKYECGQCGDTYVIDSGG